MKMYQGKAPLNEEVSTARTVVEFFSAIALILTVIIFALCL